MDPESDLPVVTTVAVPCDDDSTDNGYDPQDDDDASSNSSIDDSIVFYAAFPNYNGDDEITGVYQNQNQDNILFPMHADADIEGVPGVDTPGVNILGVGIPEGVQGADDSIDNVATVDIPGMPHPQDSNSDSDSDDDEHHLLCTQSGRAMHSTHKILTMCTPPLDLILLSREFEIDHSCNRVKPLTDCKCQNFIQALEFLEHHDEYRYFLYDYVMTSIGIREGLKVHGTEGKASVIKEINNLVSRECYSEVPYKSQNDKQKKQSLPILRFMILKRDGKLKLRG